MWNLPEEYSHASTQSLVQLQDILKLAIPKVSERTEIQQADLFISRQWLKDYGLATLPYPRYALERINKSEHVLPLPATIARDGVLVSQILLLKAFEANSVGILEKVFDIGCSLSDVLSYPNFINISAMEVGPRDYLMKLVRILGPAPGDNKYLRLPASKADEFLGVHTRGSLSEIEASDRMIEEIEDDDEGEITMAADDQKSQPLHVPDVSSADRVNDIKYPSSSSYDSGRSIGLGNLRAGLFAHHPISYIPLSRRIVEQYGSFLAYLPQWNLEPQFRT